MKKTRSKKSRDTVPLRAVLKVGRSYLWTEVISPLKFHSDGVRLSKFKGQNTGRTMIIS